MAELECPSGLQCYACYVQHGRSWIRGSNLHHCLWTRLQVHGSKWLSCQADPYTVSRCHIRGESEEYRAGKRMCKPEIHPVFETQNKKALSPPKKFNKKERKSIYTKKAIQFFHTYLYILPYLLHYFHIFTSNKN